MQTEDNNGNDLAFRPTYQGGIGINYLLPYQLNTRIDYRYIGSQYNTDATPLKLDSYNTLDMQLSKTFDSRIIARVGAKNITDERLNIDYRHQLVGKYIYSSLEYSF
jgi:outer membrane receptor protein involved in Fe transport